MKLDFPLAASMGVVAPWTDFLPTFDMGDPDFWVRLVITVTAPVLLFATKRLLSAGGRATLAVVKALRDAVRKMREDADPGNDSTAAILEVTADALEAGASSLDGETRDNIARAVVAHIKRGPR